MILRNDDVAFDTTAKELETLHEICQRRAVRVIHCITPIGEPQKICHSMSNPEIVALSSSFILENEEVMKVLAGRPNFAEIAVHGFWHTHEPAIPHVEAAAFLLRGWGLEPEYFVPPFNEGTYPDFVNGLKVVQHVPRIEDFIHGGKPKTKVPPPVMYLHSWRVEKEYGKFTWKLFEECLKRITNG